MLSFRIEDEDLAELDRLARQAGVTQRSEILRRIVKGAIKGKTLPKESTAKREPSGVGPEVGDLAKDEWIARKARALHAKGMTSPVAMREAQALWAARG